MKNLRFFAFAASVVLLLMQECESRQEKVVVENLGGGITVKERTVNGLREGRSIMFFRSGQIKQICYSRNGYFEGPRYWFYEKSQRIHFIEHKSKDELKGRGYEFFESGRLKGVSTHVDDSLVIGPRLEFFDDDRGLLKTRAIMQIVKGEQWIGGVTKWDSAGNRIVHRGYPTIELPDSIKLGKSFVVKIGLAAPERPFFRCFIGRFDSAYRLVGSSSWRDFQNPGMSQGAISIKMAAPTRRLNWIRGWVEDIDTVFLPNNRSKIGADAKQYWFSKKYVAY